MTVTTERDLTRRAERLRDYLQDPRKHWTIREDRDRSILQTARVHDRELVDHVGEDVVVASALNQSALTADLGPDGAPCRWCHAIKRGAQLGRFPPVTPFTVAMLGYPCDRCSGYVGKKIRAILDEVSPDPEPEPVVASATMSVRDAIALAYRLRREREAANLVLLAAAAADGDSVAQVKLDRHHAGEVAGGAG